MTLQLAVKNELTRSDLQCFTNDIANSFNAGEIRAPVHLSGGNEDQLIDIFSKIGKDDWVCSTWRSHYHCLLRGVPPAKLKKDILNGRSIALCYPEYRILSSAIVAGNLPIAVGLAWSVKRQCGKEWVWAFCGDMAASTGMFSECVRYSWCHQLPIIFVIEDNGKSVCTDTVSVWGRDQSELIHSVIRKDNVIQYKYILPWPHSGAGKRVNF